MRVIAQVTILIWLIFLKAWAHIDVNLQMQLGNPSGATANTNNHDHYLIQRTVEAIDYSDNLGEPNWASWDLTTNDLGSASRSSSFYTDNNLPDNFYHVTPTDYNGVGAIDFNRGHLCPSADRTDNSTNNKLVFYMSNIMPQSALNNQGVWGNLESDCRTLAEAGNELLIICGPSGFGTNTIPSGKAYIPSNVWKIIVVVPQGSGTALDRISVTDRVIAVSIPNVTNGLTSDWHGYLTSPNQIQQETGLTFFTALPPITAAAFRAKIDGASPTGITNVTPLAGNIGRNVTITGTNFTGATHVWFNGADAAFTYDNSNKIIAIVPAGATTGPISITAAGGLATSMSNFSVVAGTKPRFQKAEMNNNTISLTVTGAESTSYTIEATTNLASQQWFPVLTTNAPPIPFTIQEKNNNREKFYRVLNP